jgi:dTDP-4-dehydrorhamnose reductase
MQKKILLIGASSNLGKEILKYKRNVTKILSPSSKELNILKPNTIDSYIKRHKPNYILHLAGLSDPMHQHEIKINESIKKNIIGTANLCLFSNKYQIKLIYISTNFVYPGDKGNFSEEHPLLPFNNYGWSKLGGECSVMMTKKSLVLRLCIAKIPYKHKIAFTNYITSFLSDKKVANIILKLIDQKGVINVGGKTRSAYDFATSEKCNVNGKKLKIKNKLKIGKNTSINVNKLKKLLKIKNEKNFS